MNEATIILLLTGILLVAAAFFWLRFPPAGINYLYGYRTGASMQNEETWKEANGFAPRLLLKIGSTLTGLGLLSVFFPFTRTAGIVTGLALVVCGLVFLIWRTERHLSHMFDGKGRRRQEGDR